jgi:glycosyltransferase involved in cell wall biosynthesis
MKVLALVPYIADTAPGQRFRIEQWEPLLRQAGVEIVYAPFECAELHSIISTPGRLAAKLRLVAQGFARRIATLTGVGAYDAVYLFREAALLGPAIFETWVKLSGTPIVFDFDDAIFVPYTSPANGYLSRLKFPQKTRAICRLSAHVLAGNPYLAAYARQFNERVTVIPTTIDTAKYRPALNRTAAPVPVIGWSGSFSTLQHLDTLQSALRQLARKERFRLRVIGSSSYQLAGVEVEALPWRASSEADDLRQIEIGIMPLPDDEWSRGKCGLKALQYMALGIPTVCSPVGVNTEIIRDGGNGLLASTESEWIEKLTLLLRSAELRARLGEAGRQTVVENYSALAQAPRVAEVFRSVRKLKAAAQAVSLQN